MLGEADIAGVHIIVGRELGAAPLKSNLAGGKRGGHAWGMQCTEEEHTLRGIAFVVDYSSWFLPTGGGV